MVAFGKWLLLLACHFVALVHGQFDWGSGCGGGTGAPFSVTLAEGATATVGSIPPDRYAVRVLLSSNKDVDVQLFDQDEAEEPIIAWCETKPKTRAAQIRRGCGLLPSDPDIAAEESVTYKGMVITYSGYGGTGGNPGKEFITIQGKTSATLVMKAFAFEAGSADVSYEWGRVQTGCCMGVAGCHGSFTSYVNESSYVEIGSIPTGKRDLTVRLTAARDVDVQLYDTGLGDQRYGSSGRAIIAYVDCGGLSQGSACPGDNDAPCGTLNSGEVCNAGPLGNNDGAEELTVYRNRTYTYSGYYGVAGAYGNEWVSIAGVLNTELNMKAYGYAAGAFAVDYTYYEVVPEGERPASPAVFWAVADANRRQRRVVGVFEADLTDSTYIIRRGSSFQFSVYLPQQRSANGSVSCSLLGTVEVGGADVTETFPPGAVAFSESRAGSVVTVVASIALDAPIGPANVSCDVDGGEAGRLEATKPLIVLANPYERGDETHLDDEADRSEYLEATSGVIFQGLSDNYEGHVWTFDQFRTANVRIALRSLRRMPLADRSDVTLLTRHLSYAIGTDVCYGKWGDGSYRTGRPAGGYTCAAKSSCYDEATKTDSSGASVFGPSFSGWSGRCCVEPGHWQGSTSLFALHVAVGHQPVQYCQCFVYAALLTTIGRTLGIASRPTTAFQSAHDTDRNRAIDKFFDAEWNPVEGISHDSIWSFHVWAEMFFTRPDLAAQGVCGSRGTSCDGWNAVDATPQEQSAGGSGVATQTTPVYQMGPASLKLVKRNADPVCARHDNASELGDSLYGCYDSEFVLSEANAQINLWVLTDPTSCATSAGVRCSSKTLDDGRTVTFRQEGSFETDPWGDEYGTVGTSLMTKGRGAISTNCAKNEDADGWTCKPDGVDITGTYKAIEPSGPGTPTACAGTALGDVPPSFCSEAGPFSSFGGGSHRRLLDEGVGRSARPIRRAQTSTPVRYALGLAPQLDGPLVHEPGHPLSWARVDVRVTSDAAAPVNVTCAFGAVAVDYSGVGYVRSNGTGAPDHAASIVKWQPGETVDVPAGGSRTFSFMVERQDYVALSPTYLDVSRGYVAVDAGEAFYGLQLSAYCSAGDGSSFVRTVEKQLCEPIIATSTRARIACAGRRGAFDAPTSDDSALAHLSAANCRAAGVTSSTVNNGVCNPANNVDGCFDGGDCCTYSCWSRNGQFIQLAEGGGWEFAHTCYALNDTLDCLDPTVRGYVAPANFSSLGTPPSFSGDTATVEGSNNCTEIASVRAPLLADCAALKELLCHDETLAGRDCAPEFVEALAGSLNCSAPRCTRSRLHDCNCMGSWTASYDGADYTGVGCANPDGDSYGDWCRIVPGSCRGDGTTFGLPSSDYVLYGGGYYDYCGTGVGSSNPVWTTAELAAVAQTLADPGSATGWDNLTVVAATPTAAPTDATRGGACGLPCPYSCQAMNPITQECVGADANTCPWAC